MKPKVVPDVLLAFPADVKEYLPPWEDLPEDYQRCTDPWCELTEKWFFHGLKGKFVPKDGIDLKTAVRHLSACMGSYQPSHEHKIGGVAFLMNEWFERFEPNEKSEP